MISVFVPGHITGFFSIFPKENKLKKGSLGCGVLLDKGVTSSIKERNKDGINIKINGKNDSYHTIISKETIDIINKDYQIDKYLNKLDINGLEINHNIEVPIGCGFGTSASSSLGAAILLKDTLNLPITYKEAGKYAHLSEVSLNCGLGDVIAEMSKGIVLRTKPGAPGFGKTEYINSDYKIVSKSLDKIDTSTIITDPDYQKRITKEGIKAQKEYLKNPSSKNFIECSYNFSKKIGLFNNEIIDLIDEFNEFCIGSSMAMIGNTVFGLCKDTSTLDKKYTINNIENNGIQIKKNNI
ncbi:MAG: pantoate kinase [Methanobrevibacter wolinii]